MENRKLLLEACVETLEDAIKAQECGADRIELCADLSVGGLTPSLELVGSCLANLHIPVMAMVRPRAGDFVYSPAEFEAMKKTVDAFKSVGVAGVVFGILDEKNEVQLAQTQELAALAKPLLVTFHKAIDECPDPAKSLEQIMQVADIQRVLTSGGADSALLGAEKLKEMMELADGRIKILAAGKITKSNLAEVHDKIGASEYHGRRIVF